MPFFAGSFLVARPVLQAHSFRQTVVLLLQHNGDGAFGLIVNRTTPAKGLPFPIFWGGPCQSEGMFMLHGHEEWLGEGERTEREVAPGIFLGDSSCIDRADVPSEGVELHCRMFSGYSGWGPSQLEGELSTGAWAVVSASAEALFEIPVAELWNRLLPPSIPQPSMN